MIGGVDDLTDLDAAKASELLARLLAQLVVAREGIVAAQRRFAGFRKMVDAVVEMFPELEDDLPAELGDDEPARPRGAAAALVVLEEHTNSWYAVPAVVNMLDKKGWLPQSTNAANAVRSALERLVDTGLINKGKSITGAVIYRVFDPDAEGEGGP